MLRKSQKFPQLHLVFQDLATTRLHPVREWEFLARWQDLETIHSMPRKAWHDLARQDRVHLDLDQDLKAENLDQVVQDQQVPEEHVPDLDQRNQDWVAEHREVFQVALQLAEEVAESAAVQLVLLVKAAQEDNLRPENQSVPREKNSNLEVFQVLVEQLFQEETAPQ